VCIERLRRRAVLFARFAFQACSFNPRAPRREAVSRRAARAACDSTEAIDANVAVAAVAEDLATRALVRSQSLRTFHKPWEPGGL
jgi:hypothetical protein